MASQAASSEPPSLFENLINSRNSYTSLFLPFILGLNATSPHQETENQVGSLGYPDRIILINPFTQEMVVIERSRGDGSSFAFDSMMNDLLSSKTSQPPASKASIDALPTVEIEADGVGDEEQCVVCLEEWGVGGKVKEMPCKHRFHGECIEKWLNIHGSCPVCRYEMPVDESGEEKNRGIGEGGGERRRGIWVTFAFGGGRRSGETDQNVPNDDSETSVSSSRHQEIQG